MAGSRPHTADERDITIVTTRGLGVATFGIVMLGSGVAWASEVLVYVGLALTGAFASAWIYVTIAAWLITRSLHSPSRTITPPHISVGERGSTRIRLNVGWRTAGSSTLTALASRLIHVSEHADEELTGGARARATIERSTSSITAHYPLAPRARGRWELGPTVIHITDPWALVHAERIAATAVRVPVWPLLLPTSSVAPSLGTLSDSPRRGMRTPGLDDAMLRDYRPGDDLRRIHWATSARQGELAVRTDEHTGGRPVTVFAHIPAHPERAEWAISLAASLSTAYLASNHPVRLASSEGLSSTYGQHDPSRESARIDLLDTTVDIAVPHNEDARHSAWNLTCAHASHSHSRHDLITAVLVDIPASEVHELTDRLPHGRRYALVASDESAETQRIADALQSAGWEVHTVEQPGAAKTPTGSLPRLQGDVT